MADEAIQYVGYVPLSIIMKVMSQRVMAPTC